MGTATITSKNQITIPSEVRRELNLRKGDRIFFEKAAGGAIVLRKEVSAAKSDGAAARFMKNRGALTVAEIKRAAALGAVRDYKRRAK